MNADLIIPVSRKEYVLKIPEIAVFNENGKQFVNILVGDQIKKVKIKTGISDGQYVEIIDGLQEGQTIIVPID